MSNVVSLKVDNGIAEITIDLPPVNAGFDAKILEEGLVYRASDIDTIWVHGYGFPRFRGGPMFYADQVGLKTIYDTICSYKEKFGDYWSVAPLLEEYAKQGKQFSDWKNEA